MATRIATSTGSVYEMRGGHWNKNGGQWETTWWAHCIPDADYESWSEINAAEKLPIQVGLRMYIGSKDDWWLSSPITDLTE